MPTNSFPLPVPLPLPSLLIQILPIPIPISLPSNLITFAQPLHHRIMQNIPQTDHTGVEDCFRNDEVHEIAEY